MSRILSELTEADGRRHGKYSELINGLGQEHAPQDHGQPVYIYVMVAIVALASAAVVTLSWKNYAAQRGKGMRYDEMARVLDAQQEKLAALSSAVAAMQDSQGEQARQIDKVKDVVSGINQKSYRETKQMDELSLDYRLMVLRLEGLERRMENGVLGLCPK